MTHAIHAVAPESPPPERLLALDIFRGVTIAGMILVNNPGDWKHVYAQLRHAEWHGCTATDLVFPFFVFILGVAIPLAFRRRRGEGADERALVLRILRRAAILFALGLVLNVFPLRLPVRIPGVLQRIGLVYAAASLLVLKTGPRAWAAAAVALGAGYGVAVGFGAFDLSPGGNLAAWLDRALLGPAHLYTPQYDPEGLLSTLPAIATALSGALAGRFLLDPARSPPARVRGLVAAGVVLAALGLAADAWIPINKSLWTPSYVLLTSGLALVSLAACYVATDIAGYKRWARPLVLFGVNPIAAFFLSSLLARTLSVLSAKRWLYGHVFARGASTELTSLAYAVAYVLGWLAVMAWLDRRRIYIKV